MVPSAERNGNGNAVDRDIADIGIGKALDVPLEGAALMAGTAGAAAALGGFLQPLQTGADCFGPAGGVDAAVTHNEVLLVIFFEYFYHNRGKILLKDFLFVVPVDGVILAWSAGKLLHLRLIFSIMFR